MTQPSPLDARLPNITYMWVQITRFTFWFAKETSSTYLATLILVIIRMEWNSQLILRYYVLCKLGEMCFINTITC